MERKKAESEAAENWLRGQLREVERAHAPCQAILTELRTQLAELRVRAEGFEASMRKGPLTYAHLFVCVRESLLCVCVLCM